MWQKFKSALLLLASKAEPSWFYPRAVLRDLCSRPLAVTQQSICIPDNRGHDFTCRHRELGDSGCFLYFKCSFVSKSHPHLQIINFGIRLKMALLSLLCQIHFSSDSRSFRTGHLESVVDNSTGMFLGDTQLCGNVVLSYSLIYKDHITDLVNGFLCGDSDWSSRTGVIFQAPSTTSS